MSFDAYLKVEGADGDSQDDKHKNWIAVLSFSTGASQPSMGARHAGGSGGPGRVDLQEFSVVKKLDKASAKLFEKCCTGEHIKEVKLELCRATGEKTKYMEYKMSDVIISSVRPGGSSQGGEDLPLEEVSFNYGKIEYIYTVTDKSGKAQGDVKAGWDQVANKKV